MSSPAPKATSYLVEINTNVRAIIEFMAKSEQHYTKVRSQTSIQTGFEPQELRGVIRPLPLGHQPYKLTSLALQKNSPTQAKTIIPYDIFTADGIGTQRALRRGLAATPRPPNMWGQIFRIKIKNDSSKK